MVRVLRLLLLWTLVQGTAINSANASTDWTLPARRLTGESQAVRAQALIDLSLVSNLDQVLIRALNSRDRYLALDAIAAMKRTHLVPQLLVWIPKDPDGFIVLTINALLTKENMNDIGRVYLQYLTEENRDNLTPGALVAMLDTLGRLGFQPQIADLESLLSHPFHEVRSAVVSSLRLLILRFGHDQYMRLVEKALGHEPFQLRVQTASLASELPKRGQKIQLLRRCSRDGHITVRSHCEQLLARVK